MGCSLTRTAAIATARRSRLYAAHPRCLTRRGLACCTGRATGCLRTGRALCRAARAVTISCLPVRRGAGCRALAGRCMAAALSLRGRGGSALRRGRGGGAGWLCLRATRAWRSGPISSAARCRACRCAGCRSGIATAIGGFSFLILTAWRGTLLWLGGALAGCSGFHSCLLISFWRF